MQEKVKDNDDEMQLATNADIETTHDTDASSISNNGLGDVQNTLSNVPPPMLVQKTDMQSQKTISVTVTPVKNYQNMRMIDLLRNCLHKLID